MIESVPPKRLPSSRHSRRRKISWLTTDAEEIEKRRERARTERMRVHRLDPASHTVFGDYRVVPMDPDGPEREYVVEIRSLHGPGNFCTCPDFEKNFLGTCKHIERVLMMTRSGLRKSSTSPFIEVFVDGRSQDQPFVRIPEADGSDAAGEAAAFVRQYLDPLDRFQAPWEDSLLVFLRDLDEADSAVRNHIRVSRGIRRLAERIERKKLRDLARERFDSVFDPETFLRYPLYPYQREGMLHLAFTGRAILADEMGLGKTVQALAAAKVMQALYGVRRVLVVCPVSLKTEWEEQIRKFTSLPYEVLYGTRRTRLERYRRTDAFFLITNYEQVLRDEKEINELFAPDLVILDEAQRIKNWRTKTARSIKRLEAPYAFVLTGTPLENRIDEIYSLVEFVDSRLLGSLFRFNREFYEFDEAGRVSGMKNLELLHQRLQPILLRRRKDEIAEQLPPRVDNNYFVPMTEEQKKQYADYESVVLRLSNIAKRRPLTEAEFMRLQQCLAAMRMLCDSVFILDRTTRVSPKIEELDRILADVWSNDPQRKVVIFSEWVRMLELVEDLLDQREIAYARHTGDVPQKKRREEINRFKHDPECRVFLSTDSGGLGLNLQAAGVVVNLDLPWNPARLEQRIARAWRKHQKQSVHVINLIAEKTIEHRMLATLDFKQSLADAVLDGRGDWSALEGASARTFFMERLSEVLGAPLVHGVSAEAGRREDGGGTVTAPAASPPAQRFREEAPLRLGHLVRLCKVGINPDTGRVETVLAVTNKPRQTRTTLDTVLEKTGNSGSRVDVTLLTPSQYRMLQDLAEKGIIQFNDAALEALVETDAATAPRKDDLERRRAAAEPYLAEARRRLRMAAVLQQGDFPIEAAQAAGKAVEKIRAALAVLSAESPPEKPDAAPPDFDADAVEAGDWIPAAAVDFLRGSAGPPDDPAIAGRYIASVQALLEHTEEALLRLVL